jgi:hypothetical protein
MADRGLDFLNILKLFIKLFEKQPKDFMFVPMLGNHEIWQLRHRHEPALTTHKQFTSVHPDDIRFYGPNNQRHDTFDPNVVGSFGEWLFNRPSVVYETSRRVAFAHGGLTATWMDGYVASEGVQVRLLGYALSVGREDIIQDVPGVHGVVLQNPADGWSGLTPPERTRSFVAYVNQRARWMWRLGSYEGVDLWNTNPQNGAINHRSTVPTSPSHAHGPINAREFFWFSGWRSEPEASEAAKMEHAKVVAEQTLLKNPNQLDSNSQGAAFSGPLSREWDIKWMVGAHTVMPRHVPTPFCQDDGSLVEAPVVGAVKFFDPTSGGAENDVECPLGKKMMIIGADVAMSRWMSEAKAVKWPATDVAANVATLRIDAAGKAYSRVQKRDR